MYIHINRRIYSQVAFSISLESSRDIVDDMPYRIVIVISVFFVCLDPCDYRYIANNPDVVDYISLLMTTTMMLIEIDGDVFQLLNNGD